tara:strand:+ start:11625 stop:13352 length:1728 start_codon:yes stop_codon:yes gene_type:complete
VLIVFSPFCLRYAKNYDNILLLDTWRLNTKELNKLREKNVIKIQNNWQDYKFKEKNFNYSIKIYNKVISALTSKFNNEFNTKFQKKFFKILFGDFVIRFIQNLLNVYLLISEKNFPQNVDLLVPKDISHFHINNYNEFTKFSSMQSYANEFYFYSIILNKIFEGLNIKYNKIFVDPIIKNEDKKKLKHHFINFFRTITFNCNLLIYNKIIIVNGVYRNYFSEIDKLNNIVVLKKNFIESKNTNKKNINIRSNIFSFNRNNNKFEKILYELFKDLFPIDFIENFLKYTNKFNKKKFKSIIKIISFAGWRYSTQNAFLISSLANKGLKIYAIQHGGGYGKFSIDTLQYMELQLSDYFISWGWKNGIRKVYPLKNCDIEKKYLLHKANKILYVSNTRPRGFNLIDSVYAGLSYDLYFNTQKRLIESIDNKIKKFIYLRSYPHNYNYDKIGTDLLGIKRDDNINSLKSSALNSELIIIDSNQTSLLDVANLDIPFIIVMYKKSCYLNQFSKKIYENLKSNGILYDSIEGASEFINNNFMQYKDWWQRENIRNSISLFRRTYCNLPNKNKNEIEKIIFNN